MFKWGKLLQSHLMEEILQQGTILTNNTVNENNLTPGVVCPCAGAIYM